jgi:hypothetical protein
MHAKNRQNPPERAFALMAERKGWKATKQGWPDFLCWDSEGRLFAVEVKPRLKDGRRMKWLKKEQAEVMELLERQGIPCFVSDGEALERFSPRHCP